MPQAQVMWVQPTRQVVQSLQTGPNKHEPRSRHELLKESLPGPESPPTHGSRSERIYSLALAPCSTRLLKTLLFPLFDLIPVSCVMMSHLLHLVASLSSPPTWTEVAARLCMNPLDRAEQFTNV
jgi:hypothetical protein